MAKMVVNVGGEAIKVKSVNAAFVLAGDRAAEMSRANPDLPLGTTITVERDGCVVLTYVYEAVTALRETRNEWRTYTPAPPSSVAPAAKEPKGMAPRRTALMEHVRQGCRRLNCPVCE